MSGLPPGFVLDAPAAAGAPRGLPPTPPPTPAPAAPASSGLPPGFTLDAPVAASPQPIGLGAYEQYLASHPGGPDYHAPTTAASPGPATMDVPGVGTVNVPASSAPPQSAAPNAPATPTAPAAQPAPQVVTPPPAARTAAPASSNTLAPVSTYPLEPEVQGIGRGLADLVGAGTSLEPAAIARNGVNLVARIVNALGGNVPVPSAAPNYSQILPDITSKIATAAGIPVADYTNAPFSERARTNAADFATQALAAEPLLADAAAARAAQCVKELRHSSRAV